jgi:hypothetical protein
MQKKQKPKYGKSNNSAGNKKKESNCSPEAASMQQRQEQQCNSNNSNSSRTTEQAASTNLPLLSRSVPNLQLDFLPRHLKTEPLLNCMYRRGGK